MSQIAQALLAEMEQEAVATRRLLERVPADKLYWKPHEKSMTLGQLANEIASIPANIPALVINDSFDVTPVEFKAPQIDAADGIIPNFEASIDSARKFLNELSDEDATSIWKLVKGDKELWAIPKAAVLRSLMFNHLYHHRGQLVVYLRLLDVPIPATYGRSADENPFENI